MQRARTRWRHILWLAPALAGCGLVAVSDPYGNQYGDWYNPGEHYRWQLATCEAALAQSSVPPPERKAAMRCCMWRHGVPIDDAETCHGPA